MKKTNANIKNTGVLLLIILVIMTVLIYINNTRTDNGNTAAKSLKKLKLEWQLDATDKNSYVANVDELMIEAAGVVVKARNSKEDIAWSKSLVGKVSAMKASSENLYIVDSTKKLYCISSAGKLLWEKQLEGEVYEMYIDRSGDLLIEYRSTGGSKIQIVSNKGVDEGSLMLEKSAILAYAAGDGENTISIIDVSSGVLKGKLITLNLKGAMVWSENFDNQVIPKLGYGKDNTLIAIGEKSIYKYKGEGKKSSRLELNKTIYSADINESGVVAVIRNRWGFDVVTYDLNLKEKGKLEIDKAPKGIISGNGNYILYYNEKLVLCDFKGAAKAEYKSIPSINNVNITSDGSVILISDRLIQKVNYQ